MAPDLAFNERSWIQPTTVAGSDSAPLSYQQVASWRDRGAVVVDQLVPTSLVSQNRAAIVAATRDVDSEQPGDFGSGGSFVFPAECDEFNQLTLHPRLLAAVAQLLGTAVREIRLTQSDLWVKRGRTTALDDPYDNDDQRIHVDYPNHSLTHPPEWDYPEAVEVIIYADDVDHCDGATSVVLRNGDDDPAYQWPIVDTPGVGEHPWINSRWHAEGALRESAPAVAQWRAEHLYAREQPVHFQHGTVLLYRHDTWHRGTPVRARAQRVAHNLTFRKATSEWISTLHEGWAWAMYRRRQTMERLIATASIDQRCVLGFPEPGHPYWTQRTIAAVQARYRPLGIDMSEYLSAIV